MVKVLATFVILLFPALPSVAVADGGWSTGGIPSRLEVVRDQGFYVEGAFGNPAGCTVSNTLFVSTTHPQYAQLYSAALAAFMGGKKIAFYSHECVSFGWFGGTHNTVAAYGSLHLKN